MNVKIRLLALACGLLLLCTALAAPRPPVRRYIITGRIAGLGPRHAAVKATRSGHPAHSATTRDDGVFVLRALEPGSWTVRPTHSQFRFSPSFHTVAVTSHDRDDVTFTAHPIAPGRR